MIGRRKAQGKVAIGPSRGVERVDQTDRILEVCTDTIEDCRNVFGAGVGAAKETAEEESIMLAMPPRGGARCCLSWWHCQHPPAT